MKPYTQQAEFFRLALEAQLVEPAEVIAWAVAQLAAMDEYDDDLANLALISPVTTRNALNALMPLANGADRWEALREIMGKLYDELRVNHERGEEIARFVVRQRLEDPNHMPQDMYGIYIIDEEFELAREGIHGTIESATRNLLEILEKFKKNA